MIGFESVGEEKHAFRGSQESRTVSCVSALSIWTHQNTPGFDRKKKMQRCEKKILETTNRGDLAPLTQREIEHGRG